MSRVKSRLVTLFTDASLAKGRVGAGWWFKCEGRVRQGSAAAHPDLCLKIGPSSSAAELWSAYKGLKAVTESLGRDVDVILQSDSLNALSFLTAAGAKFAKGSAEFEGARIPSEVFYSRLLKRTRDLGIRNIWLKHVRGHTISDCSRAWVNKRVDKLARSAIGLGPRRYNYDSFNKTKKKRKK